jgi:tetratricopeptide (TPR) repeat protein
MKNMFNRTILIAGLLTTLICCLAGCAKKPGYRLSPQETQQIQSRMDYAESFYAKGDYGQAQPVFEEITQKDPDNADAHYRLGVIYGKQGNMDQSAREFLSVVSIDEAHPKALYNLGVIYSSAGPLYSEKDATQYFNKYLAVEPDSSKRQEIVGWLTSHGQRVDAAPAAGKKKTVEDLQKDQNSLIQQADAFVEQQKYEQAESIYMEMLAINPQNSLAHYKLGVLNVKQGKMMDGRAELLKSISLDPGLSKAYYNLGVVYSTKGETYDVEKAEFFFRKYLELEPNAPQKASIEDWLMIYGKIKPVKYIK